MLERFAALWVCHREAFQSSLNTLCRTPLASLGTITLIAIALVLPALFGLTLSQFKILTPEWQASGHVALYLKSNISNESIPLLLKQIRGTEGVISARYISPEAGLLELQKQEGLDDIELFLSDNPLPAVIDIVPSPTVNMEQFRHLPEVSEVKIDRDWMLRLQAMQVLMQKIVRALILLFGLSLIFIVGNALRFTIQKRREEIEVLKLLGATDPFIARPFLYTGLLLGFVGALLALLFVVLFLSALSSAFHDLFALYHVKFFDWQFSNIFIFILSSALLSWLGASLFVRRELRYFV